MQKCEFRYGEDQQESSTIQSHHSECKLSGKQKDSQVYVAFFG